MLFIIIPVYNEEDNIKNLLLSVEKHLVDIEHKIIVVNDGSTDNSLDILYSLNKDNLIIESYLVNMNIGAAFSTGIQKVLGLSNSNDDYMVIMEGDQTSTIDVLLKLIDAIKKRKDDIVIASRFCENGNYKNFPLLRRIYSVGANELMARYLPINNVRDYSIFFRVYSVSILRKAVNYYGHFGLLQSKGFTANAELLVKLSFLTDKISEIPFMYNYGLKKGASKIKIIRTIMEYLVVISYLKSTANKVKRRSI